MNGFQLDTTDEGGSRQRRPGRPGRGPGWETAKLAFLDHYAPRVERTGRRTPATTEYVLRSLTTYLSHVNLLQRWAEANHEGRKDPKRPGEITRDDLRAFLRSRTNYASRTQATVSNGLCVFYAFCEEVDIVRHDPSLHLKRDVRRVKRTKGGLPHYWLRPEQIRELLDSCQSDPLPLRGHRDQVILVLGLFAGLRREEIIKLNWSSYNAYDHTLAFMGKGGKLCRLPLFQIVWATLDAWKNTYSAGLVVAGTTGQMDRLPIVIRGRMINPLPNGRFAGEYRMLWGSRLAYSGVDYNLKHRCREVHPDFPKVAAHDLRRSFAGWLRRSPGAGGLGKPLEEVQRFMRHESLQTTIVYLEKDSGLLDISDDPTGRLLLSAVKHQSS